MDDGFGAFRGPAEAVGIRHVALDELAAPGLEALLFLRPPREHANRQVLGAERVDDVAAHETRPPDDEDGHSKFFQYRLAVGPAWPWYLEPSSAAP